METPSQPAERPREEILPWADQLFRDGLFREAAGEFSKQVNVNPGDVDGLRGLGRCQLALRDFEPARDAFKKALALSPGSVDLLTYMAEAELELGHTDQARDILAAVQQDPEVTAHACFLYGKIAFADGDYNNSAQVLQKALDIDSSYSQAAVLLGEVIKKAMSDPEKAGTGLSADLLRKVGFIHLRRDNKALALGLFRDAAGMNVKDTQMYLTMGHHLGDDALYTQAILVYQKALTNTPESHEVLSGLALAHGARGDYKLALDYLTQALIAKPDRPDLHVYRGDLMAKLRQYDEAGRSYYRALQLDPNDSDSYVALGNMSYNLGRESDAVRWYQQAVMRNPSISVAYFNLSILHERRGSYSEALRCLRQFRELSPQDVRGPLRALSLMITQDRLRQAVVAGKAALEQFGQQPGLLLNLGITYLQMDEEDQARQYFEKVLTKNTQDAGARVNLGVMASRGGDSTAARSWYEAAVRCDPSCAEGYYNLGVLDLRERKHETAAGHFQKAIEADRYMGEAYHNLGICMQAMGRETEAGQVYRMALEMSATAPDSLMGLGQSLEGSAKLGEALDAFKKLVETAPDFAQTQELLLSMWSIHRRQQNWPRARKVLEGALFMDEKAPEVHLAMGVTHQESGGGEAARKCYERVLRLDPGNPYARANLAVHAADFERNLSKATTELTKVLDDAPMMAEAHYNLGVVHAANGFPIPAVEEFRRTIALRPDMYEPYLALVQARSAPEAPEDRQLLEKALELNPKSIVAWIHLGITFEFMDLLEDSLASFQRALMVDPKHAVALFDEAVLFDKLGDFNTSAQAYKKALSLGETSDLMFNLAEMLERANDVAEAKAWYLACCKKYPQYYESKVNVARLLRQEGGIQEAVALLTDAVRLRPKDPLVLFNWVVTLIDANQLTRAEESVRNLLDMFPEWSDVHLLLGVLRFVQERHEEAVQSLRQAASSDPRLLAAHGYLALSLVSLEKADEALVATDSMLSLAPELIDGYLIRAEALADLGRTAEALTNLQRAQEIDAKDIRLALMHARHLLDEGQWQQSYEVYQTLSTHFSGRFRVQWGMGEACFMMKRFDDAAAHFADSAPPRSQDPKPAYNQAVSLLLAGRPQEALAAISQEQLDPAPEIPALRGRLMLALDRPEDAIPPLEEAIEIDPEDTASRLNLAAALLASGQAEKSASILDDPTLDDLGEAWFQRGLSQDRLGRLTEAESSYRMAARAGLGHAHLNRALIHRRRREHLKELGALRSARTAGVDSTTVALLRAQSYLLRGMMRRGLAALQESDPEDPLVWVLRGSALMVLGLGTEAVEWLQKARSEDATDECLAQNLTLAYLFSGQPQKGLELLDGDRAKLSTGSVLIRTCLLEQAGDQEGASAFLKEALETHPDRTVLWVAQGNQHVKSDIDQALYCYLRAYGVNQGPPPTYLLANLGRMLAGRAHPWATLKALAQVVGPSRRRLVHTQRARPILDNLALLKSLRHDFGARFTAAWLLPFPDQETTGIEPAPPDR